MMEAAYWWGIKPPYPAAPVPSRVRERASELRTDGRTETNEMCRTCAHWSRHRQGSLDATTD